MASCTLTFERANGLFRVDRRADTKRVTEEFLRNIGDMDIAETIERAKNDPYIPQNVQSHRRR